MPRLAVAPPVVASKPAVVQASYHPEPAQTATGGPIPISLDIVFRLAEDGNAQIALAREKLNASDVESQLAAKAWLPDVYGGIGYYRHEGGIQNPDGTFIHSSFGALFPALEIKSELDVREAAYKRVDACRKVWQQRGELSKVTNETLLDAAITYVDLLTARRGEAVGRELEKYQTDLLNYAKKLLDPNDRSATVLVESIQAEMAARHQALARLHQQGDAASAKLAYLLGLGPDAVLVPVDVTLAPIDLVDVSAPVGELVSRALATGPGVRELEGLLNLIQDSLAKASGPGRLLPSFRVCLTEGAFGAGPGSRLDWDNRLDLGLQARWNLTEFVTAREKRRLAESGLRQAQLSYQDLRGKLTLGVQEAREAILSGRDQIKQGAEQIKHASETYRLSDLRLKEKAPGATTNDVLQSIRGLELAHFGYLTALSAYNKAEVRLLLLLGPEGACR
jgi:outer membrane protein TolC